MRNLTSGALIDARALVVDERAIEKHQKHAAARVGERLHHVPLIIRFDPCRLGTSEGDDVFEGVDLLLNAVFEDLEVRGLETVDNLTVARRIRVHPDEVRADADRLLRLGGQHRHASRQEREDRDCAHGYRTTRIALTMRCDLSPPMTSISIA